MEYIPMEWLHVKSDSEKIEEYDDLKLECEELRSKLKETQEELFESDLKAVQAERDALQARIDRALDYLRYREEHSSMVREAIKVLTGEGENA